MKKLLIPLSIVLLAVFTAPSMGLPAPSPDKPALTIKGPGAPGTVTYVDVTGGTPGARIGIVASLENKGASYSTPWGTIKFDIGPRLFLVMDGQVDRNGGFQGKFKVPRYPPQLSGKPVFFQGVEAVKTFLGYRFDTTNVDKLVLK